MAIRNERGEEAHLHRARGNFSAALAGAIGVAPAKSIAFTITPNPFLIVIAFVAGHDDDGANRRNSAHRVQQRHRAADIGRECPNRILIGFPHQRLSRKMENDFRLICR